MLNIKIFKNIPSNLYVGIYRNGMVSIYKNTMDYFPGRDGITIGMGDDGRLYFKFTVKDNDSFKINKSKSGSYYVNTSRLFSMNNIDKKEYVYIKIFGCLYVGFTILVVCISVSSVYDNRFFVVFNFKC